ncbi:hypothetical protein B7P43_G12158 [Cryptotermes secundus]|uniref:SPIN-DOC-like zinc-finger domain-containing protein n=1 Tax=Cryptotermes secundus TaxID=105785 RepID=A0A2J7QMD2_9NEOP|nr:hypothetical protein B7P43_G12158 [Cryptotermes secundus]
MSNSKLRKVDSENRAFKSEWEHDYFFILNKDHKPQCLVCFQVLAVLKEYNLKRHYMTNHKQKFGKHSCESRKVVCDQLKKKLFQQKSLFTNETKQQEEALLASYFVTYELMKAKKALSDGELIKNCAIKIAEAFNKVGNKFQTVPLSKQTVTRRLEDISNQISNNVKDIIANCSYFSIALDESIDVSDTNQLLIFVRAIKKDFIIFEELLKVCPLHNAVANGDNNLLPWPPRSADLTPCDFFLWGFLKGSAYAPPLPTSIHSLRDWITHALQAITEDMLHGVWDEFDYRVDVCRVTEGAHTEGL